MKCFKVVFFTCVAVIFGGCATLDVPEVPQLSIPANAKVGMLINVGDNPTHAHVGTTLLNNFSKKYPYDWNMKEAIFQVYKEQIESSTNLDVIDLQSFGIKTASELDFVDIKDEQWSIVEANSNLKNNLTEENIYAVITVTEKPTLAQIECGAVGCSERYIDGFGLFSRGFLGIKNFTATAGFEVTAEIINPPVELSAQQTLRNLANYQSKSKIMKGFKAQDLKNVTDQELAPVKAHILQYIQSVAEATSDFLK